MKLDHAVTSYEESQDDTNETGHHVSRGGLHGVGAELKEKKEKFEGELKKELKKVQRFRDQIRTWQGSDMKIDAGLQTQMEKMRKTIESHMERFKEQERKSKTKPFSTGALQAKLKRDKNDPKYKTLTWINNAMQKLQEFGELVEAEIESLSGSKSKASQRTELDEKKLFFDNHVEKLEMVRFGHRNPSPLFPRLALPKTPPSDVATFVASSCRAATILVSKGLTSCIATDADTPDVPHCVARPGHAPHRQRPRRARRRG